MFIHLFLCAQCVESSISELNDVWWQRSLPLSNSCPELHDSARRRNEVGEEGLRALWCLGGETEAAQSPLEFNMVMKHNLVGGDWNMTGLFFHILGNHPI